MAQPPVAYQHLVSAFDALPGVGPRAAARLAQFVLRNEAGERLQQAIASARSELQLCQRCYCLSTEMFCTDCSHNTQMPEGRLYVVADLNDYAQVSEGKKNALFVLHGLLSPASGVGPTDLKLAALRQRVQQEAPNELILLFSPGVEADATEWFIRDMLQGFTVSRQSIEGYLQGDAE